MKSRNVLFALLALFATVSLSADETDSGPAKSPEPSLEFISGAWVGGDETTRIEEIWSQSSDGLMFGMFRMLSGGEPRFYELMSIERTDTGWAMFLRHFSAGLDAWEEKEGALVFDLAEVSNDRALFDQRDAETNLIYVREGDELTVTLEKLVDGEWKRTPFRFRRER